MKSQINIPLTPDSVRRHFEDAKRVVSQRLDTHHSQAPFRATATRLRDAAGRTIARFRKASGADRALMLGAPAALTLLRTLTATCAERDRNIMAIQTIQRQQLKLSEDMARLVQESKIIQGKSSALLKAAQDFLAAMPQTPAMPQQAAS